MKKRIFVISLLLASAVNINAQETDFPRLTGPYLGQKPPGMKPEIFTEAKIVEKLMPKEINSISFNRNIPSEFDWRERNIMTPVKHQMNLGSCGVFAAVAVFEALIKKETGINVDLSEQQVINGSKDFVPSGISSVNAMKYMKEAGLVFEERLPYQDKKTDEMPEGPADYRLTDYQYVKTDKLALSEKIETIKKAVLGYGPVATNMIFYQDLDAYKEGVYVYDGISPEQGGHWVVIVGWKNDPEVNNGGYWICRNSWGDNWGKNGYFNIAYGECGIDDFWFVYGVFLFSAALSPDQNIRQVTTDPAPDYHVKWSPDGKTLAFTSQRSGEPKIWLVPAAGGDPVMLETGLSGDHHISWAPDSRRIVFDASYQGRPNIFTISLDSGKPKRLSEDGAIDFHPYWSPDGSLIAFASLRSGNTDIWIMPVQGGQPIQLTKHKAEDYHPVWSPDGSKIAFSSNRSGNYDIWIIPASGGEAKQLTFHESRDDHVSWSPDGTKIAFMSERGGKRDIWIMSIAEGEPVRFTEESDNSWPSWSPDGKQIAFASKRAGENNDIWIKIIWGRTKLSN
jgi:Tol biopolymer transport system component